MRLNLRFFKVSTNQTWTKDYMLIVLQSTSHIYIYCKLSKIWTFSSCWRQINVPDIGRSLFLNTDTEGTAIEGQPPDIGHSIVIHRHTRFSFIRACQVQQQKRQKSFKRRKKLFLLNNFLSLKLLIMHICKLCKWIAGCCVNESHVLFMHMTLRHLVIYSVMI